MRSCIARAGSASGNGRRTTTRASPDVVLAAAATPRRSRRSRPQRSCASDLPDLKVRVVNVVDLMRLQPESEHPHGLSDSRVRRALHDRPARRLRVPRLSVADPPAHVSPHEPREPARARLQGRGNDDDAVRHGDAERPRPFPSRHRRDRPRARPRRHGGAHPAGDGGRAPARPRVHARARRGRSGDSRLDLA